MYWQPTQNRSYYSTFLNESNSICSTIKIELKLLLNLCSTWTSCRTCCRRRDVCSGPNEKPNCVESTPTCSWTFWNRFDRKTTTRICDRSIGDGSTTTNGKTTFRKSRNKSRDPKCREWSNNDLKWRTKLVYKDRIKFLNKKYIRLKYLFEMTKDYEIKKNCIVVFLITIDSFNMPWWLELIHYNLFAQSKNHIQL